MDALLDPAIFTSDFSEASLTNTPTPKNPATTNKPIPKARMPAAKAPKKNKNEKQHKTPPHSWTHNQNFRKHNSWKESPIASAKVW
jgi:hypothetical protein